MKQQQLYITPKQTKTLFVAAIITTTTITTL